MDREKVEKYFRRIGLALPESITPDAELLRRLQSAHSMTVPYDNGDLLRGGTFDDSFEALYKKVVEDGYGGICLDLNRLFAWLLRELGYQVTDHLADYYKCIDSPLKHRIIIAEDCTGQRWLCDVGDAFEGHLCPIELREGAEHTENGRVFCAERHGEYWYHMEIRNGQRMMIWRVHDSVTPEEEFFRLKRLGAEAKDTPLMKTRAFSVLTSKGRKTFFAGVYREFTDGATVEKTVGEADAWVFEQFGLEYPSGRDRKWAEQK